VSAVTERLAAALADRYRIERELGRGGMATVYLAHDLKHDRDVALKVLHADLAESVGRPRFLREIQLAAKLSHPHILPLFDSGEADGLLYYVMPNVSGQSLRDRLERERQLPVDEAVRIATEVAGALDHAHRQGVVHRDIKPENIMLQDGHALVADFGIGKALSAVEGQALTQTGVSVGTPAYMSPEQAAGETVDGRSDLYSLGCVLYEMLVGEQPFTGPNVQSVIAKRFVQTPADVSALREGVPRPVARAVQQAMARTAIDRFHTGAQLAAALAEPATPVPPRTAVPERSIAVLPFANLSADPENEFFCDGVTEEVLNALTQLPGLRVAGRTSSFSFKGKSLDLRSIGEQLQVRTVLEGSVRRAGTRVRITAQLTDASDGYRLWSERYDREIADVFAVQDEIAGALAERWRMSIAGESWRAQRATRSIEAYEAFLKGRALFHRRALPDALVMMQQALAADPEYGPAWAGVAEINCVFGYIGAITPEQGRAAAMAAAAQAVRYAPDLAEAHFALGSASLLYAWDWEAARRAFERGMALNPGAIEGASWDYVYFVGFFCGRTAESLAGLRTLLDRDPLSAYLTGLYAIALAAARDASAMEWARRTAALDPDAILTHTALQIAAVSRSDWAAVIAQAPAVLKTSGRGPLWLVIYAYALLRSGNVTDGRALCEEVIELGARAPVFAAAAAAIIGDRERAARWLSEAFERRDPGVANSLNAIPGLLYLAPMRQLPEWHEAVERLQLPSWIRRADD
jgi:serine/threonine-protein kinase